MKAPTRHRKLTRSVLALSVGTAVALCAAPAQADPPVTVSCGQTLTQSVTLANDLTDCPGDGLVIGADNITVDLNGHTVDGVIGCGPPPSFGVGIRNDAGHDGVTVGGGTVQQFFAGFRGGSEKTGMSDSRVHHLIARENLDDGIAIGTGDEGPAPVNGDNRVEHNVISDPCGFATGITLGTSHKNRVAHNRVQGGLFGIYLCCEGADRNVLARNSVSGTQAVGIAAFASGSHNVIRRNSVSKSADDGILALGQSGPVIQGNRVFENEFGGIRLIGADASEVSHNRLFRNGDNVIVSGSHNRVIANRITDAVGCEEEDLPGELACGYGISVEDGEGNLIARNRVSGAHKDTIRLASFDAENPTVGTVVRGNLVRGAGIDGISISTEEDPGTVVDTLILGNRALGSSDDGIDVEEAATTLTRNRALRNPDLGIEAVPGVTDGGGNRAAGNGNPLQCTNVFCS